MRQSVSLNRRTIKWETKSVKSRIELLTNFSTNKVGIESHVAIEEQKIHSTTLFFSIHHAFDLNRDSKKKSTWHLNSLDFGVFSHSSSIYLSPTRRSHWFFLTRSHKARVKKNLGLWLRNGFVFRSDESVWLRPTLNRNQLRESYTYTIHKRNFLWIAGLIKKLDWLDWSFDFLGARNVCLYIYRWGLDRVLLTTRHTIVWDFTSASIMISPKPHFFVSCLSFFLYLAKSFSEYVTFFSLPKMWKWKSLIIFILFSRKYHALILRNICRIKLNIVERNFTWSFKIFMKNQIKIIVVPQIRSQLKTINKKS